MIDLSRLAKSSLADEHPEFFLRRHLITQTGLIVSFFAILLLPIALLLVWKFFQPEILLDPMWRTVIILGGSIFWLFAWLFMFQNFIDYYLDMWLVTNRRILSIEQVGLFSRTVSESRLHRVQDVTATVNGLLHTLLDYGDVEIQTAGEEEHFIFEQIPHPNRVAKAILELAETDRRESLDQAVEEFGATKKK